VSNSLGYIPELHFLKNYLVFKISIIFATHTVKIFYRFLPLFAQKMFFKLFKWHILK